jgi:hypothetical protein
VGVKMVGLTAFCKKYCVGSKLKSVVGESFKLGQIELAPTLKGCFSQGALAINGGTFLDSINYEIVNYESRFHNRKA